MGERREWALHFTSETSWMKALHNAYLKFFNKNHHRCKKVIENMNVACKNDGDSIFFSNILLLLVQAYLIVQNKFFVMTPRLLSNEGL